MILFYYKDYPDKNRSKVNALAIQYSTSEDAKNEINEQIKSLVDEKTVDMQPIPRHAFDKAIQKWVDKAVEATIKNIKNNNTQTKLQENILF